jgi:hypothetical protein
MQDFITKFINKILISFEITITFGTCQQESNDHAVTKYMVKSI